jgi:hypothetical protein
MKKTWLFIALSCVSIAANATETNGLGYSHVDLEYVNSSSPGAKFKGPATNASVEIANGFFATGSYSHPKNNDKGALKSLSEWSLGGGYAAALGKDADWVTQAAYVEQDAKVNLGKLPSGKNLRIKDDASGFRVSTGARGRLAENLIGHAYLGYQDLGAPRKLKNSSGHESNAFADLGLEYNITDHWAATARTTLAKGLAEYAAGLRLSF